MAQPENVEENGDLRANVWEVLLHSDRDPEATGGKQGGAKNFSNLKPTRKGSKQVLPTI